MRAYCLERNCARAVDYIVCAKDGDEEVDVRVPVGGLAGAYSTTAFDHVRTEHREERRRSERAC